MLMIVVFLWSSVIYEHAWFKAFKSIKRERSIISGPYAYIKCLKDEEPIAIHFVALFFLMIPSSGG